MNTLRRIAGDLVPFLDGRRIGIDMLDLFEVQTELIYRELVGLETRAAEAGGLRGL